MRLKNRIAKRFLIFLSFLLLAFLPVNADYAINVFTGLMDYYETGLPTGGAAGGITYFDGTDWQNLAVGANGFVLTVAAGTPVWAAGGAPAAHAASHAGAAADPVNHNTLANYVAAEHLDWTADQGASNIHDNNILASSVTQHVASIDHNLLLNYVAGEHLVLPSTIAAVLTDHNLAAHTAIGIVDLQNVFYISPVGGDYATIQAALTAENAGGEVFLVGPGTYAADTINFSANNQTVRGVGLTSDAHITQVDATICNFGAFVGCRIENLFLEMTAPTTAKDLVTGSGDLKIRWCHLRVTNANVITADQPTCIDTTGDIIMTFGTVEYANTGNDGGGATAIKASVRIGVGANILFRRVSFEITGAGQSLAITPVYGTAGTAVIHRCNIDVDDDVSTNTIGFIYSNIVGGTHEMFNNWIHVDNANNTAHGIFLLSTETVRSMHNHIHVTSAGGTAVSATTAAGTTWVSQFDDIIAANGDAAGGTLTMISSETGGNLTISGLTASHPVFTNASNVIVSTGTMPVDQGGTNMTSYTIGDILYASAAGILSGLADVAVNQVLVSGGVGVAPAYSATPTLTSVTVGNTGLTVGTSTPFSDAAGTLTLQNIDVLGATTEGTIEGAIDTLASLTSATFTFGAAQKLLLNAVAVDHTDTAGVIDLNVVAATGVVGMDVSLTSKAAGLGDGDTIYGLSIGVNADGDDHGNSTLMGINLGYVPNGSPGKAYGIYSNDADFDYAIFVDQGNVRFDGSVDAGSIDCGGVITAASYIGIEDSNELRFYDNGNYVGFEAPALGANQIWVLPTADGNAGDVMQTNGAGTLTWVANAGGGTVATDTIWEAAGDIAYATGDDVATVLSIGYAADFLRVDGAAAPYWDSPGIANTNPVVIDHAEVADDEYARFTASGLESLTPAEVLADLSADAGAAFDWNTQLNDDALGYCYDGETTATPSGAFTVDWTAKHVQRVTITGVALDITFTNPPGPCRLLLVIVQGDGDDTIDWTHEADILFPGGVDPTLSTGNGEVDIVAFYFDGTSYFGLFNGDFQ